MFETRTETFGFRVAQKPVSSSTTATITLSSTVTLRNIFGHRSPYLANNVHDEQDASRSNAGQDHAVCRVATIGLGLQLHTEAALITADAGIAMVNGCLLACNREPNNQDASPSSLDRHPCGLAALLTQCSRHWRF